MTRTTGASLGLQLKQENKFPQQEERHQCASISINPKHVDARCLVPGSQPTVQAAMHRLMDGQTDFGVPGRTFALVPSPSAERRGMGRKTALRKGTEEERERKMSFTLANKTKATSDSKRATTSSLQGYGESCSGACWETTKAASSGAANTPAHAALLWFPPGIKPQPLPSFLSPPRAGQPAPKSAPAPPHGRRRRSVEGRGAKRPKEQPPGQLAPEMGPSGTLSTYCRNRAMARACNEFINRELVFGKYTLS